MTIDQITQRVTALKPVSRRQVIRYLNDCDIKPSGARQRPQQYPQNSAIVILHHLGLAEAEELTTSAGNGVAAGRSAKKGAAVRIPSMAELRNTRRKAGRK